MRVRECSVWVVAGVTGGLALAACGSSSSGAGAGSGSTATVRAAAAHDDGAVPVAVTARFPARQRLAQRTRMVVAVRNTGDRALPNIAVSICDTSCAANAPAGQGTDAQAFGHVIHSSNLANASRPLWIINRPPGACAGGCANETGQGAGVTANSNTWALGRLAAGHTARFVWTLTPIVAGSHRVAWQVAGDLSGDTHVSGPGGSPARGTVGVDVSSRVPHLRVTTSGEVVTTPR